MGGYKLGGSENPRNKKKSFASPRAPRGGGGVIPNIGYTGMCHWKGYGFQAIWSDGLGSRNHRKLVWYRDPFNGITHKTLKSRTIEQF